MSRNRIPVRRFPERDGVLARVHQARAERTYLPNIAVSAVRETREALAQLAQLGEPPTLSNRVVCENRIA